MDKPIWMWSIFYCIVIALLIIDLGIFNNKSKEIGIKKSLWMSAFYILIALLFGLWIWSQLGFNSFAEYLTGFLVEKTLALDNIFVISLIFSSLSIPLKYQHRVLFWGIIGVVILRGVMIAIGAQLINEFSWILYVFALFMIFTGIKMFFISEKKIDINQNILLQWMRKHLRITQEVNDERFFILQADKNTKKSHIFITPLFIALIFIELTDLVFAVDSVPAIFTITKDPYIIYTSNIFAILGLRALYFCLASIIQRFHYLKYALALVLIFIGSKIFISDLIGIEKFPPIVSLLVTFGLLIFGCIYSLYKSKTIVASNANANSS
jgi:tellurite resistance protein TerC